MNKRLRYTLEITAVVVVLGFILYSYFTKGLFYSIANFNIDEAVSFISSFLGLSFVIYIFIIILSVILTPIHPFIFYVAGGIVFGPYISWLLVMIGEFIGSTIAFKISGKYGRIFVEKRVAKEYLTKFDNFSDKYGAWSVFFLRLNPLTSSDIWNYVAGLTKIKFWKFLLGTMVGLAPAVFVQVYFGKAIKENEVLLRIFIIIAIAYLILIILGLIYFFLFRKPKKETSLK